MTEQMPMEHVLRQDPPWRTGPGKTECGKEEGTVKAVLSREAFVAKVKKQGIQRAGLTTCMTCIGTFRNHFTWEQSPSAVIARQRTFPWGGGVNTPEPEIIDRELWALAALAREHAEEFAAMLAIQGPNDLTHRRARRAQ